MLKLVLFHTNINMKKKADIFRPGWRFTVETFMVKKTKNYWYYDIRCAYLKW